LAIEKWDILKEISTIHAEVDRIFQGFFKRIPGPILEENLTTFIPPVNVYDDGNIIIEVALPGVKKEDIDLSLQDNILTISGVRLGKADKPYYQQEWQYGHFEREITLPIAIKGDNISAEYKDGILTISIPKKDND
jgi:HSP20 family protein